MGQKRMVWRRRLQRRRWQRRRRQGRELPPHPLFARHE
jgi:hypothetical protein